MSQTETTPPANDKIAAQVAAYEADLRRRNEPANLAREALRHEWADLHSRISGLTGSPPLFFQGGRNLMNQFEAAQTAGDIDTARELVGIAHNAARPWDHRPIPENDGMRARRLAAEEEARLRLAEAERRFAEQARQALLQKFPDASYVLREVEKRGALRLDPSGAVTYTGEPLDADTVRGLSLHEPHVRNTLRQRWFDKVVLPAPEPAGPAAQAAA